LGKGGKRVTSFQPAPVSLLSADALTVPSPSSLSLFSQLGMEDGDTIDVFVEAIGGGL